MRVLIGESRTVHGNVVCAALRNADIIRKGDKVVTVSSVSQMRGFLRTMATADAQRPSLVLVGHLEGYETNRLQVVNGHPGMLLLHEHWSIMRREPQVHFGVVLDALTHSIIHYHSTLEPDFRRDCSLFHYDSCDEGAQRELARSIAQEFPSLVQPTTTPKNEQPGWPFHD